MDIHTWINTVRYVGYRRVAWSVCLKHDLLLVIDTRLVRGAKSTNNHPSHNAINLHSPHVPSRQSNPVCPQSNSPSTQVPFGRGKHHRSKTKFDGYNISARPGLQKAEHTIVGHKLNVFHGILYGRYFFFKYFYSVILFDWTTDF